jgi:pimeloyl-ACP methyl ester carboxylesterase
MSNDAELKVILLERDDVALAHVQAGPSDPKDPPLVLIHGWIGDHNVLMPQIRHFAKTRRVVAIHLRGHGESDAPVQDYTMQVFADDIAWQCRELGLEKPVLVGHSLGGAVALETAGRHPDLVSGIVIIDSILLPPKIFMSFAHEMKKAFKSPGYIAVARAQAIEIYLDHFDPEDPKQKDRILATLFEAHPKTPEHAAVSTMLSLLNGYDPLPVTKACKAPMLYIDSGVPMIERARDLDALQAACPQLVVAKTYGAGHFSPLEVPDQVNAMIARFLAVGLDRPS